MISELDYGNENYHDLEYGVTKTPVMGTVSARQINYSSGLESFTHLNGLSNNTPITFIDTLPDNTSSFSLKFPAEAGALKNLASDKMNFGFYSRADFLEKDWIEFYNNPETLYDMTISKYQDVGGIIEGTITFESIELYSRSSNDEFHNDTKFGDFKVEIEFKTIRTDDIHFYSLKFDENGGEIDVFEENTMDNLPNLVFPLPDTGDGWSTFEKLGHTFVGWNTKSSGTGTSYAGGSSFTMPSYDVTLYAIWEDSLKGTWKAVETEIIEEIEYTYTYTFIFEDSTFSITSETETASLKIIESNSGTYTKNAPQIDMVITSATTTDGTNTETFTGEDLKNLEGLVLNPSFQYTIEEKELSIELVLDGSMVLTKQTN